MKKLRLFYIYKFDTSRLKEYNYDITITPDEARRNGELVSVGDSQVLRTIRKITKSNYSEDAVKTLEELKYQLKKKKLSKQNIEKLGTTQENIDKLLHIPEYISIIVKSKGDYKNIVKNGVKVNNIKFVRLMCGAGHARKNTVILCAEYIDKELKTILKNKMKNIQISHSKYNAYFALYSSATHVVSSPKVCVIPDKVVTREHLVDWVQENNNGDTVEEKNVPLEFNFWDGMGIISPRYARKWAKELGIDGYIPSAFTIRNGFIKGMVCTMPFHAFSRIIAKTHTAINDVWSLPIKDIRKYDMVLTESQFKLWKAFDSWESFENNCNENGITWGISRVAPKEEKKHAYTNYQFVQAINLNDDTIKSLCKPTIDWLEDVCGLDIMKTLLFLSGNSLEDIVKDNLLNISEVKNNIVKSLILNNNVIHDSYAKRKVYNLINKKIKESYIGKLLVEGNFQVMISDPYAFCEHLFGIEVKGLLQNKQHYSYYWNKKGVNTVVAMRSPLTWRSEVNKLNLQNNGEVNRWFKYLKSGIVYTVHGVDCMLAADSDYDYDIVMTTNSGEFVNNCYGGLPITYKKNTTPKSELNEDILYLSDLYSFNSQIGQVTNYSTSMYCMLAEYEEGSSEYSELINRLKICRKEQGSQIDKAKGIIVKEFPTNWIKEQSILNTDSEKIRLKKEFENRLVIKKKPYFMRWLYSNYNKQYKKFKDNANTYCSVNFGCGVDELIKKPIKTVSETEYLNDYLNYLPLNEAECSMNKLAKYMESVKFDINKLINDTDGFDYSLLIDKDIEIQEDNIYKKVLEVYEDFKEDKHLHASIIENESTGDSESKDKFDELDFDNLQQMYNYYKKQLCKICSDSILLANIAVDICYRKYPKSNKDFVWELCSTGLLENIKKNKQDKQFIPVRSEDGYFKYLGEMYKTKEVYIIENTR